MFNTICTFANFNLFDQFIFALITDQIKSKLWMYSFPELPNPVSVSIQIIFRLDLKFMNQISMTMDVRDVRPIGAVAIEPFFFIGSIVV